VSLTAEQALRAYTTMMNTLDASQLEVIKHKESGEADQKLVPTFG